MLSKQSLVTHFSPQLTVHIEAAKEYISFYNFEDFSKYFAKIKEEEKNNFCQIIVPYLVYECLFQFESTTINTSSKFDTLLKMLELFKDTEPYQELPYIDKYCLKQLYSGDDSRMLKFWQILEANEDEKYFKEIYGKNKTFSNENIYDNYYGIYHIEHLAVIDFDCLEDQLFYGTYDFVVRYPSNSINQYTKVGVKISDLYVVCELTSSGDVIADIGGINREKQSIDILLKYDKDTCLSPNISLDAFVPFRWQSLFKGHHNIKSFLYKAGDSATDVNYFKQIYNLYYQKITQLSDSSKSVIIDTIEDAKRGIAAHNPDAVANWCASLSRKQLDQNSIKLVSYLVHDVIFKYQMKKGQNYKYSTDFDDLCELIPYFEETKGYAQLSEEDCFVLSHLSEEYILQAKKKTAITAVSLTISESFKTRKARFARDVFNAESQMFEFNYLQQITVQEFQANQHTKLYESNEDFVAISPDFQGEPKQVYIKMGNLFITLQPDQQRKINVYIQIINNNKLLESTINDCIAKLQSKLITFESILPLNKDIFYPYHTKNSYIPYSCKEDVAELREVFVLRRSIIESVMKNRPLNQVQPISTADSRIILSNMSALAYSLNTLKEYIESSFAEITLNASIEKTKEAISIYNLKDFTNIFMSLNNDDEKNRFGDTLVPYLVEDLFNFKVEINNTQAFDYLLTMLELLRNTQAHYKLSPDDRFCLQQFYSGDYSRVDATSKIYEGLAEEEFLISMYGTSKTFSRENIYNRKLALYHVECLASIPPEQLDNQLFYGAHDFIIHYPNENDKDNKKIGVKLGDLYVICQSNKYGDIHAEIGEIIRETKTIETLLRFTEKMDSPLPPIAFHTVLPFKWDSLFKEQNSARKFIYNIPNVACHLEYFDKFYRLRQQINELVSKEKTININSIEEAKKAIAAFNSRAVLYRWIKSLSTDILNEQSKMLIPYLVYETIFKYQMHEQYDHHQELNNLEDLFKFVYLLKHTDGYALLTDEDIFLLNTIQKAVYGRPYSFESKMHQTKFNPGKMIGKSETLAARYIFNEENQVFEIEYLNQFTSPGFNYNNQYFYNDLVVKHVDGYYKRMDIIIGGFFITLNPDNYGKVATTICYHNKPITDEPIEKYFHSTLVTFESILPLKFYHHYTNHENRQLFDYKKDLAELKEVFKIRNGIIDSVLHGITFEIPIRNTKKNQDTSSITQNNGNNHSLSKIKPSLGSFFKEIDPIEMHPHSIPDSSASSVRVSMVEKCAFWENPTSLA